MVGWLPAGKLQTPAPDGGTKAAPAVRSAIQLGRKLADPVNFPDGMDQTPLKDALEHVKQRADLPIILNEDAFRADLGDPDVKNRPVRLDPVSGLSVGTVLRLLVGQVQGSFLVRPGYVEVLPELRVRTSVWGNVEPEVAQLESAVGLGGGLGGLTVSGGRPRPMLPLVHSEFDRMPLDKALAELAERTGVSVILDSRRANEMAKAPVTAALVNVPADTAVRLVADQAGLEVVLLDNALYVTTAENAKAMRDRQRRVNQAGLEAGPGAPGGS
jgi:hypothetical protein